MNELTQPNDGLLTEIKSLIDAARQRTAAAVNAELTLLYWQIGSQIRNNVLDGKRAEYGKQIIKDLAAELTNAYGCLLYTSPSPRDATLSRMPSSA